LFVSLSISFSSIVATPSHHRPTPPHLTIRPSHLSPLIITYRHPLIHPIPTPSPPPHPHNPSTPQPLTPSTPLTLPSTITTHPRTLSPLTSHLSPLTSHLSPLISHLSSLTPHLSHLITTHPPTHPPLHPQTGSPRSHGAHRRGARTTQPRAHGAPQELGGGGLLPGGGGSRPTAGAGLPQSVTADNRWLTALRVRQPPESRHGIAHPSSRISHTSSHISHTTVTNQHPSLIIIHHSSSPVDFRPLLLRVCISYNLIQLIHRNSVVKISILIFCIRNGSNNASMKKKVIL
jgi:hypothetical protein